MEESVKIAVRWQPIPENNENKNEIILKKLTKNAIGVNGTTFLFDEVLDGSTQLQVYGDLVKPLVQKAISGFNSTVLAYGQTGTGKTYTMGFENNENVERNGITMRAIDDIFSRPDAENMKISLSFIEIYNEQAFDLLGEKPTEQLNVKGTKNSLATKKPVQNLSDAQQILAKCLKNRRVRQTKMNPNSSRSHGILTIHIEVMHSIQKKTQAMINLVDLAGSEGVRRTSHTGEALLEGNHINQGLLCIAKVIKALSRRDQVIPYRDTVLTTVLQNSLNLRSYLILLACITPYQKDCSQTLSTLRFTASAKTMKITPHLNAIINNYRKSLTPAKATLSHRRETPGSYSKTSKELFKSPLPLRSNQNHIPVRSSYAASTSKLPLMSNSRFSTPLYSNSKTTSKINRNMHNKSKTAQKLFPENNNISETSILTKDDSFDNVFPMDISTSTAILPRTAAIVEQKNKRESLKSIPTGFSPIFHRVEQIITEQLAPVMSTLQNTIQFQTQNDTHVPIQAESIRSIARQMIEAIPKNNPLETVTDSVLNESNCLVAPPSTPANEIETNSPVPKEPIRRSARISIRRASIQQIEPAKQKEQPVLRRSSRISMMAERAPLAEIPISNIPSTTQNRKLKKFSPQQAVENMTKASNKNAKKTHKEFVLSILNEGTLKDLQILPMIGNKTAYQILTYRLANGTFESIESLKSMPFWNDKKHERFVKQNNL